MESRNISEAATYKYYHAIQLGGSNANFINSLTYFAPKTISSHPIIKASEDLQESYRQLDLANKITDEAATNLILLGLSILEKYELELKTGLSQIYRRNSIDLNCDRHANIFKQHNIIPSFCFGCYKVQVEPRSLLDLVKVHIVFDQLRLVNNTRKCAVELRPQISGFYKGLIYCSSLEQAQDIKTSLNLVIKERVSQNLISNIKRGCSEYPISHPTFKKINFFSDQPMKYNEDWKIIEEGFDKKRGIRSNKFVPLSLPGLHLQDLIIIRKWIDYARGIGDRTVDLFPTEQILYHDIYNSARNRLISSDAIND